MMDSATAATNTSSITYHQMLRDGIFFLRVIRVMRADERRNAAPELQKIAGNGLQV